jgi:hypothetical protein
METKNKLNEHTANLALSQATAQVFNVGRNFAKPIPRKVAENKKSFWQQFKKV